MSKLQDKLPDTDMIKTSIGKRPDRIGAMVLQQASELKVIMQAHIKRLQKMAVMPVDKVNVAEFKDVATTAAKVLEDLGQIKVLAKPHNKNSKDAMSARTASFAQCSYAHDAGMIK